MEFKVSHFTNFNMQRWLGKVAVVTGASSGIGYAIAEALALSGIKVVAVARRMEKLEELKIKCHAKNAYIYPISADMTKEADIINIFSWTKANLGPVHILVNNAGIARDSNLCDGNTQMWKDTLDTNILGLCIATREAVQDMRANKVDGHIIHINSTLGHSINNVMMNVYPASKYAVTALTETLRNEFNSFGDKIKISSVSPGLVNTDATSHIPDKFVKLNPEDLAKAVKYVLSTPPHVQIHELTIAPFN